MSSCGDLWRQFRALAWKNAILKTRNFGTLLLELVVPTVIIIALGLLNKVIPTADYKAILPDSYTPTFTFKDDQTYNIFHGAALCYSGKENLIWSCDDIISNCPFGQFNQTRFIEFQQERKCRMKKIAIAPASGSNTDAQTEADNFVLYGNTYYSNYSTFQKFNSESDFIKYITSPGYSVDPTIDVYSAAIIIEGTNPAWSYKLRLNQTFTVYGETNNLDMRVPNLDISTKTSKQSPYGNGYTYLQTYLANGLISLADLTNSFIATRACQIAGTCTTGQNIEIQTVGGAEFPSGELKLSQFWTAVGFIFALLMILSLLYPIANVIRSLVQEKETKIKEGMMMMALRGDAHYLSWIVHFMCLFLPLSIILTIAGQPLFQYSNPIYIFFYFILFFMAATSYSFLVSKLFNRALTAAVVGCVVFFMGFFIFIGLQQGTTKPSRSAILAASLHPACAFTYGTLSFSEYEGAQVGITNETWNKSNFYPISFQDSLTMMFVDTIYLAIVSWYLGKVWPSEFGTHLPWYFPFLPSYYVSCFRETFGMIRYADRRVHDSYAGNQESVPIEPVAASLSSQIENNTCVDIRNLYKEFETSAGKKVAVDNLNLTMYSGQITALLGHNGAGKTTTISMLTGLIAPDGGTAIIEGLDINTDLNAIRRHLGVCPQHDVLFPDLTVIEHLKLFAAFKGSRGAALKQEVDEMIQAVGLTEKKNARSKSLSGGQKRKLSVGIAFIGGSKVVFLDEPTSGMDPYSRRFTWNVIRQHREGRVVVLTTHFMDEADLLGDRIAIMGDGKLKCCGSSLFLKNVYGVGYSMTLEKKDPVSFDSNHMKQIVTKYVPENKLLTDAGGEISFQLPLASSGVFEDLFNYIDDNNHELGIESYGVSVTTLEEVFIKVTQSTDTITKAEHGREHLANTSVAESREIRDVELIKENHLNVTEVQATSGHVILPNDESKVIDIDRLESGNGLSTFVNFKKIEDGHVIQYFLRHLEAMVLKRALYFSRDRKSWIFQYGVPLGMVLLGMIVQNATSGLIQPASKTIDRSLYNTGYSTNYLPTWYNSDPVFCALRTFNTIPDCTSVYNQTKFMNDLPSSSLLPTLTSTPSGSILDMSTLIYSTKSTYGATQIGAYSILTADNFTNTDVTESVTYLVHSNYSALHGGPLYQVLFANSVVKSVSAASTVTMTIHDMPYTDKQATILTSRNVALIVTFIMLAIPWLSASFTSYVVREREVKSKHQQMVSGVSVYAYWIGSWIWDFISYQVTLWAIVVLIAIFPGTKLLSGITSGAMGLVIGLLILFGSSISGFCYCLSFLFKTPSGAQIIMVFIILILGLILTIVAIVLRLIPNTTEVYMNVLRYIFCLFPPFALGEALNNMVSVDTFSFIELQGGQKYALTDMKITGVNLIFMGWESVAYLLFAILYEYWSARSAINLCSKMRHLEVDNSLRDEDVLAEEERVKSGQADESSTILVKDMKKMYPGGKYAVRGVSLGIPNGECFGLLGINGAGKSTTLSMLSGEFKPSSGEAYLSGMNLLTDVHKCRRKIGFCPQFDSLFDLLTGREHLQLYARIKGIVEKDIPAVVDAKIAEMGLTEYADRSAQTYSGGNKRKLSVAIAMIGEPSIVFLDEPSTGMDPVARRFMWKVITDIVTKREKCSVILTTHSMEECEALCTRIGIMVGGVLRCLGTAQHLRSRYGHGYQLEIGMMIPTNDETNVLLSRIQGYLSSREGINTTNGTIAPTEITISSKENIEKAFTDLGHDEWIERLSEGGSGAELIATLPNLSANHFASWCILEESYDKICTFLTQEFGTYVLRERQLSKVRVEVSAFEDNDSGNNRRRLGHMFGVIEKYKHELRIQDYSIAQTSLEQIFNQFAAQQEEEKGPAAGIVNTARKNKNN